MQPLAISHRPNLRLYPFYLNFVSVFSVSYHNSLRVEGTDSGEKIIQKHGEVAVVFVQRQPGNWPVYFVQPLDQQRGFAVASRGGDEGKVSLWIVLEVINQARPGDEIAANHRLAEFCFYERNRFVARHIQPPTEDTNQAI